MICETGTQPCRSPDMMTKTHFDVESRAMIVNCVPLGNVELTLYLLPGPTRTSNSPFGEFARPSMLDGKSLEIGSEFIETEGAIVICETGTQPSHPPDVWISTHFDVESRAMIVNCVPLGNVKFNR